jgi:WD40 repeat protein
LVVGPFRPRRDPFAELAEAFVDAYQRDAPSEARSAETRDRVRALRAAGPNAGLAAKSGKGEADHAADPGADERLSSLLKHLEELRRNPPAGGGANVLEFLDWSLDDLKRICGEKPPSQHPEPPPAATLPLVEMADHLRRASGHRDARVLLVIDQFEELLGQDHDREGVGRFLTMVRSAIEAEHSPLMTLGTMRSDFLARFQHEPALLGIDFESLSVGPMTIDGMRRAIEEPARLATIELEPGLADRLLKDAETPDALPLLSFTLSVLWRDGRADGRLDVGEYDNLGGLQGTIAREADAVLDLARKQGKEDDVRRAFLQMARLTEEGAYARQPVSWDRAEIQTVQANLQDFERRRLLVTRMEKGEQRTVEVAHEALFRSWAPLKAWLDSHRGELLLSAQLRRDARAWEENRRSAEHLWHGGRLQQAEELMRKGEWGAGGQEVGSEVRFVRAGVRRRRLMRGTMVCITASVIAVLSVLLVRANTANIRALAELRHATSLRMVGEAAAMLEGRLPGGGERALQEVLAAHSLSSSMELDASMMSAVTALGGVTKVWTAGAGGRVKALAFSPDGSRIATGSVDNQLRLWDVKTGRQIGAPAEALQGASASGTSQSLPDLTGEELSIVSLAFSPDATRIVTGSSNGALQLWGASTGQPIGAPFMAAGREGAAERVAFSRDGSRIVSGGDDGILLQWNASDLRPLATLPGLKGPWGIQVARSPDGARIASVGDRGELRLTDGITSKPMGEPRDAITGGPIGKQGALIRFLVLSPDGARLAVVSDLVAEGGRTGPRMRLWNTASGQPVGEQLELAESEISAVAFSLDGSRLAAIDYAGTLGLWDGQTGKRVLERELHQENVCCVALGPDGSHLTWVAQDGTLSLFSVKAWGEESQALGPSELTVLEGYNRPGDDLAFSPTGVLIAAGSAQGPPRLWNARSGRSVGFQPSRQGTAGAQHGFEGAAAVSDDGSRIVSGGADGALRLWDGHTRQPIGDPLAGDKGSVASVAITADSSLVATGGVDGTVRLRDGKTGQALGEPLSGHNGHVESVSFSRDASRIVSLGEDGTARLWDARSRRQTGALLLARGEKISAVAYSPDGLRIVSGSERGEVQLWDSTSGKPIGKAIQGDSAARVTSVAFNPKGTRAVSGNSEGDLRLWDAKSGRPLPARFGADDNTGRMGLELAFSHDGSRILSVNVNGELRVWLAPDGWAELLCSKLTRNMTRQQWKEWVSPEIEYQVQCRGLPIPE